MDFVRQSISITPFFLQNHSSQPWLGSEFGDLVSIVIWFLPCTEDNIFNEQQPEIMEKEGYFQAAVFSSYELGPRFPTPEKMKWPFMEP